MTDAVSIAARQGYARKGHWLGRRLVFASLFATAFGAPLLAQENVVIENHKLDDGKGTVTFNRIEFAGTNLSRDEVMKLFSAGTSKDDAVAIAAKLKAERINIPSAVLKAPDADMTMSGFVADKVDAGKVGRLAIAGFDGSFVDKNGGKGRLKSGPMQIDGANIAGMFQAIRDNDLKAGTSQFTRFSMQNVEVEAPDDKTPASSPGGNLIKIKIGAVTADASYDGPLPLRLAAKADNMSIELPPTSEGAVKLKEVGVERLNTSLAFSGTYDPAKKVYGLSDLSLQGEGLGTLSFNGQFTGIDAAAFSGAQGERLMALLGAGVSGIELKFANGGIIEKVLAQTAKQQNKSPENLKQEMAMMAGQIVPMMLGGDVNALRIADALSRFANDPKQLTITAKAKSGSVGFVDLLQIRDPASLFARADVEVLANGVAAPPPPPAPPRAAAAPQAAAPQATAPTAAPPAARGTAPSNQSAQAGAPAAAPNQRLTGIAAWNALVGNSITGKNSDGDALTEYYMRNGTVKQLTDDETATGKWVVKGEKVCFEFPDDDDDEETCYRVMVDGNIATFTDDDGSGRRYEILRGNPKRL